MKIFLLSLLAIGSVQSLTLGYPYRTGYWAYNPARGEFPVQSSVVQSYIRYIDNGGNERVIGYSYPEPVQGQRQISYVGGVSSPVYRTYSQDEFSEFVRACDAHFRVWALQQYQVLKREIDALRAQGIEPSADMLLKFQPLEKIALTSDFSIIADLPDIKRLREEHLQIWNKAREQNLQSDAASATTYQQSNVVSGHQGELKTYEGQSSPSLESLEDTPEQKQAREDNLRIYNEQIASLKQLESEYKNQQQQQNLDFSLRASELKPNPIEQQKQYTDAISELERAKQEHFRLWNEAKLRAEQGSFRIKEEKGTTQKEYNFADKQQISALKYDQTPQIKHDAVQGAADIQKAREEQLRLINDATLRVQAANEHQKQIEQQQVVDTPEVIKAREEHLRLVNEAKLRVELAEQQEQKHKSQPIKQPTQYTETATTTELRTEQKDSADHLRAQEEHLRLVNEATLKIQAAEQHVKQLGAEKVTPGQSQSQFHQRYEQQDLKSTISSDQQQQVVDTPEVIRAREEHLRLVSEANSRAQSVEQHKPQSVVQPIQNTEAGTNIKLRFGQEDSADHLKAHEEHLRAVNEATLKIQAAEEHIKQLAGQQITPGQTQAESHYRYQQQNLKSSIAGDQQHQVVDTPEVIKAREDHLRLVNEAKLRVQEAKQQELKQKSEQPIQFVERLSDATSRSEQDSAEYIKNSEEHLRAVNEATLKIHAAEEHIKQLAGQQITPIQSQQQSHYEYQQQQFKSSIPVGQEQHQVVDTPEVKKAREEHLRLVNEANLRAQSVEQQELKYKQENKQESHQVPLLKAHIQHQPIHHQEQQQQVHQREQSQSVQNSQYHSEQQSSFKSNLPQAYQQHQLVQQTFDSHHHISDTPEVQKAREEHLRIFNAIKSDHEQKESKIDKITEEDKILLEGRIGLKEADKDRQVEFEGLREAQRLAEEQRQIEAELQRLKKEEQQRLELEEMREAKRLVEEQRKMEAELQRLKLEEAQRLEMERLLEVQHLKEEQEKLQTVQLKSEQSQQTKFPETSAFKQTESIIIPATKTIEPTHAQEIFSQQQFAHNPFLRANPIQSGVVNRQQHSFNQQQQHYSHNPYLRANPIQSGVVTQQHQQRTYTNNPFFKTTADKAPIAYYPVTDIASSNSAVKSSNSIIPVVRYVQSSQQSSGHKHQHTKDDFVNTKYTNTAGSQPADTAVALYALERATNDHLRAHELALEQLRLARLQNPKYNDCD